jgi:hypothetical protein
MTVQVDAEEQTQVNYDISPSNPGGENKNLTVPSFCPILFELYNALGSKPSRGFLLRGGCSVSLIAILSLIS